MIEQGAPVSRIPIEPVPPPRAVTSNASRRAWIEPAVRIWWLAASVFALLTLGLAAMRAATWLHDMRLVRHGVPVTAVIEQIGDWETESRQNASPDNKVHLHYQYSGRDFDVFGFLDGRQERINLKDIVTIRIDPADPSSWTYRQHKPPITDGLLGTFVCAACALAASSMSLYARRRAIFVWREGVAMPVVVISSRQTALAPRSALIKCAPIDGMSKRVNAVYLPLALCQPKKSEVIWIIRPNAHAKFAIAAIAYQ